MKRRLMEALATGIYSGKSPWAPGTMGTILALPLVYWVSRFGPIQYMFVTFVAVVGSVFVAHAYEAQIGEHDSREIVIDEIVGFMVAMTWLPMTWQALLAGFVLFRLFDILKPFPIGLIDKKIEGGLGVVADDVAAGVVTNVILQLVYVNTTWLGLQWVGVHG